MRKGEEEEDREEEEAEKTERQRDRQRERQTETSRRDIETHTEIQRDRDRELPVEPPETVFVPTVSGMTTTIGVGGTGGGSEGNRGAVAMERSAETEGVWGGSS